MENEEVKKNTKLETPMLNKMIEIQEQSALCGEFLEYLQNKYDMFEHSASREEPVYRGTGDFINSEKVLADFFGIDLEQAEKERMLLLHSLTNKLNDGKK